MSVTLLGFFFGLKHALEADHLAAVAAMLTRAHTHREVLWQALAWAGGHAVALLLLAGSLLLLGGQIGAALAAALEATVGAVLLYLGLRLLLLSKLPHLLPLDMNTSTAFRSPTAANQAAAALKPSFLVGLLHGAAGSAVLVAVTAATTPSPLLALFYVSFFALGSVTGMALVALLCAHPLTLAQRRATVWMVVNVLLGIGTMLLGALLLIEASQTLLTRVG